MSVVDAVTLRRDVHAARHARARVARCLSTSGVADELIATAVLLTSELVTNAVRYGGGAPVLRVALGATLLRVSVDDPDPGMPQVRDVDRTALGGRGMRLVTDLADAWGVEPVASGGKRVWFVLGLGSHAGGRVRRETFPPPGQPGPDALG